MKILYDYQIFYNQDFGGISRYFFELFKSYKNDSNFTFDLPIEFSNNIYLKDSEELSTKIQPKIIIKNHYQDFLKGFEFKGKHKIFKLKQKLLHQEQINDLEANRKISIEKLKEGNFDIFHPTYYDNYFLEYIGNKPFVITVYDMIHQIFPEYFLRDGIDKSKVLLQKANKIIAISECTKKDLVSIFGIDEHKIEVTYLANSLASATENLDDDFAKKLPENFLLFVGNREAYKNFYFFMQAYGVLANEFKDLHIVCTGKPFDIYEQHFFKNLGVENKICHFYINDAKLSLLYQHAKAFVFPSMYEGFGIPVLEAFACGCPVIVSNAGSLPEVGGDAVFYFDAKNMASLIAAMRMAVSNDIVRKNMIQKGYEQLNKFSWNKTAIETKSIYQKVG